MGTRWTDKEDAILKAKYFDARSIDDVANMLGRSRDSLIKRALTLGLSRKPLHEASMERLVGALSDVPTSAPDIAAKIGCHQGSTAEMLRRGHAKGLCRIADYRISGGRGRDVSLWVKGGGEHATNDVAVERAALEARRLQSARSQFKPFRDPFTAVFFGEAA